MKLTVRLVNTTTAITCKRAGQDLSYSYLVYLCFLEDSLSGTGKHASTFGACPVHHDFSHKYKILRDPKDKPTTTPASIMHRHTGGNRLTTATKVATPNVTLQEVINRFRVACSNPMLYKGAKTKLRMLFPCRVPMIKVQLRFTTSGENFL